MPRVLLVLSLALPIVVGAAWWGGSGSAAVPRGLEAPDAEALAALLRTADLDPSAVRLVRADGPCAYARPGRLRRVADRWLGRTFEGGCVGVWGGRVVSLALVGAKLADLRRLAAFPALRDVSLRNGGLRSLAGLEAPCPWRTLDVPGNAVAVGLDDLKACTRLERLDLSRNRVRVAPPLRGHGALRDLNLRGNPLDDLSGLEAPAVETLNLADTRVRSLAAVPTLPALQRLHLQGTDVEALDLADFGRWPALTWVWLHRSPLARIEGDYAVENALSDPVVRAPGGLALGVSGTPFGDRAVSGAHASHDGAARHPAEALPRFHGRWQASTRRGRTRTGFSTGLDVQGTAAWLRGARTLAFDVDRGVVVTVEASVEAGRLRAYVGSGLGEDGLVYAEAIPGTPLRVSGPLLSAGRGYFVAVEAVGGRAEGVRWSVRGSG